MDFQQQAPQTPVFVPGNLQKENKMATASMVLGILGGVSTFLLPVYFPCLFGSISLVLAFLSKGSDPSLSRRAKTGFLISLASILINAFILAGCFFLILRVPEFQEAFEQVYEQIYGESFYE